MTQWKLWSRDTDEARLKPIILEMNKYYIQIILGANLKFPGTSGLLCNIKI